MIGYAGKYAAFPEYYRLDEEVNAKIKKRSGP